MRQGVPMMATELGGGGGVDPRITDQAEVGLRRVLQHFGMIEGEPTPLPTRVIELASNADSLFAQSPGLFDRRATAGTEVKAGDLAGFFHHISEPERPSTEVRFPTDGFVLAHTCRGLVDRGDMLALVAQAVETQ